MGGDMSKRTKKQHYVPQFILRNFSNKNTKNNQIFVFNKKSGKTFSCSPENIAHENRFYDIEYDNKNIYYEPFFASIETKSAPIIRKILQSESISEISLEDKKTLSYFIILQASRTKHAFEDCKNNFLKPILTVTYKKVARHILPPPKGFHLDDVEVIITDDNYCKSLVLSTAIYSANKFHEIIANRKWILFERYNNSNFIIGDHPVIMDNNLISVLYGNLGLLSPGVEIYFPISPHFLLGIFDRKDYFPHKFTIKCDMENMKYFNSRQIIYAESFLFSSKNDWSDCNKFLQLYPNHKNNAY